MHSEVRQELQRLLSALCDGALTDAEHGRLEELLDADIECRRVYLEYMDLHARLVSTPYVGERVGTAAAGAVCTPERPRRRVWQVLGYVMVASATLAASLLVQVLWRPSPAAKANPAPRAREVRLASADHIATLTQAVDCVWDNAKDAPRSGLRLSPGELRLRKGIARIRFDNGPDLLIEGPALVRLDSGSSATVLRGKVVFRADETASPFDLRTPTATLVDLGTEYAVAVGPEGEEVHVFDGEVQRKALTAAEGTMPEQLRAGEARRYSNAPEDKGGPAVLDPTSFVRRLSPPNQPDLNRAEDLLAYEGFDYQDPDKFRTGKANGGTGWKGNWLPGLTRPLLEGDKNLWVLNVKEGLTRPGAASPGAGGCFDYTGFAKYHRRLATPIHLDEDATYYLSFLFRRHAPPADPLNVAAILLRTTEDFQKDKADPHTRLNIGIGGENQVFTHFGGAGTRTPLPLEYGETYLLVAKIAARVDSSAQVFIRVYGPRRSVQREEPNSWTCVGPAFESNLVFDWLEVHVNSRTRQTIDELRLGTTWPSVTSPWIAANAQDKP